MKRIALVIVLSILGSRSLSWAAMPSPLDIELITPTKRPPLSPALDQSMGVIKSYLHSFLISPMVYDSHLTGRLEDLAAHRSGIPTGLWLGSADRSLAAHQDEVAALDLVAGEIWRGPDGSEVAFVEDQRAFTDELVYYLETRGRGGNKLTARWWGSFIVSRIAVVSSYQNGDFNNAKYHHTPSMYGGSWIGQTYLPGESNLLHSNWGKTRNIPFSWDIDKFITAASNVDDTYWKKESGEDRLLRWKANFETFANLGSGLYFTDSAKEVQGTKPTFVGGSTARVALGEHEQWNFHASVYKKVAGGIGYSFEEDNSIGGVGQEPFNHWTNATVGGAWIPADWVRLATLYSASVGSGPHALDREETADANITLGDSRRIRIAMGANYVLNSSHPMRHDDLSFYFDFGLKLTGLSNI